MGGISEPIDEPAVVLVLANSAERFVWRATDPWSGTTYTLRLIATGLSYDAAGLPSGGSVARVEIRTQTAGGNDTWVLYHTGAANPLGFGPLTNPDAWVGTSDPVRPVIAMPAGVPITTIDGYASTTGSGQADDIGPLRGLTMAAFGGAGDDTLRGGGGDDSLDGQSGHDSILGGTGHDSLTGDAGNDVLRGGLGNDRLDGGANDDALYGGVGDDALFGGLGRDTLHGGEGDDQADGGAGDDLVILGAGNDAGFESGLGHDTIYGGSGADWLMGFAGNDALYGGSENDRLFGGAGDDTLSGGAGDDLLVAGADTDVLHGGAGADVFVFSQDEAATGSGLSQTTILDFTPGQDRLMIVTGPVVDLDEAFTLFLTTAQDVAGGVLWTDDFGATVLLKSVSLAALSAGDILPAGEPLDYYLI